MAFIETDRARKFKLFRNGDDKFFGKDFVLNKRRIRTWDAFLQQVTTDVKLSEAARSIRTPTNGTEVNDLENLQGQAYVAVGTGRFKKLEYTNLENGLKRLHGNLTPRNTQVKPVEHSRIQVSGRIRKIPTDVITIYVYPNGEYLGKAHRITLTHADLHTLDNVIGQVAQKVRLATGAVRKIYTVNGELVTDLEPVKTGCEFVAVGADVGGFKRLQYGINKPAFNNSPRRRLTPLFVRRASKFRSQRTSTQSEPKGGAQGHSLTSSHKTNNTAPDPTLSPLATHPPPRARRPQPPSQRKQPQTQNAKEEDSVFHAKPVKYKRSGEKREVNYDQDQGGVYRSKNAGKQRETEDAEQVQETQETRVDLPIDQVEAEEIQDEEIEHENDNNNNKKPIRKQKNSNHNNNNIRYHQRKIDEPPKSKKSPAKTQPKVQPNSKQQVNTTQEPTAQRERTPPKQSSALTPQQQSPIISQHQSPAPAPLTPEESPRIRSAVKSRSQTPPKSSTVSPRVSPKSSARQPSAKSPSAQVASEHENSRPVSKVSDRNELTSSPKQESIRSASPERFGDENLEKNESEEKQDDVEAEAPPDDANGGLTRSREASLAEGHDDPDELVNKTKTADEQELAALRIQANYRGYLTRRNLEQADDSPEQQQQTKQIRRDEVKG